MGCGKERLAIDGGARTMNAPLPQWPKFDRRTDAKVLEILHSGKVNYWTGEVGREFEREWARWLGTRNAIAVSSGTAALHAALVALGIGAGDEVICPACSFIASSFCVLQAGAMPVFCDVGRDHLIDPAKIERCITPRTRAIVVVHLFGMVADMDRIMAVARRHGLAVVEDCAQSIGGEYRGRKVGSIGTVGCFSFCQAKQITSGGEGGMVCTGDDALAWELRAVRDHGYDVKAKLAQAKRGGGPVYAHCRVGYNYRMTEMQSAIALGELRRYDRWNLPRRRMLGEALMKGLSGHPLVKYAPVDTPTRRNSFWLVPFVLRKERLSVPVERFVEAVQAEGVGAYKILWGEMYRAEAFQRRRGFGAMDYPFGDAASSAIDYATVECPVARSLAGQAIGFWTHPTYSSRHIAAAVRAFRKVAAAYMRDA